MPHPAPEPLFVARLASPIGTMLVVFDTDERLRALDWIDYAARLQHLLKRYWGTHGQAFTLKETAPPAPLRIALDHYFAGDLAAIEHLRIHLGGTPFQRAVWQALRAIPAGQTMSYGALARELKRPLAVRAVGAANGANPIGLVVPCHRVIRANGALTGYGGGLSRKRWLLTHEGVTLKVEH